MYFAHFQPPNCRARWPLVTLLLSLSFANLQGMMRWAVSCATYSDHFQRPNCTVRWPLLLFLLFLLLWFLVNVSGIVKIVDFQIHFWRMFQVWALLLARVADWAAMTLPRREPHFGWKWAYYLDETRMRRPPGPTIILYIEYIIYLTITITIIWNSWHSNPY